jgi:small subunit ribosomal protein S6
MHFDAHPTVLQQLDTTLKQDPRVIRHTVIKLGSKVDELVDNPEKSMSLF